MATSVDERIVQAKFDASDFEKGVNKTIKKLDELKKSLNLDSAKKSVVELAEKTEASTSSMSKNLDKLTDRFTNFAGMIKQKILGGLADEVAGVFFKIENSIKSLITGISTQQIGAGLDKYQQILTSVRVMVSAGQSESASYGAIEKLSEYSDQTSYSLSQMTDAMSKMVAAGVDLDTAAKSVEGIANACANAGVNATDAQRAFYNLSQAYSKGVLNYTDYKSLELLNMTTAQFKEQMLEAAVNAGTLTKQMKKVKQADGTFKETAIYKTSNKKDKKVKSGKTVNFDNISDMLKYDFMNKAAMNELFGNMFYFDEQMLDEIYKEFGFSKFDATKEQKAKVLEEAEKRYGKVAVAAYNAAKEARSFNDVLNAVKDAVSTGWSKTFEHLFGTLEQAKEFFTELSESKLAEAIYQIGTWRNAVLEIWNGDFINGKNVGGTMFREAIMEIVDALGTLFATIEQIIPGMTELQESGDEESDAIKNLGRKLKYATRDFRDFADNVKSWANKFRRWMNEAIDDKGTTRIERLRNILSNLGSVFGIVGRAAKVGLGGLVKILDALSPLFDGVAVALEKVTNPLSELKNNTKVFNDIEDSITNLSKVLEPIAVVLGEVLGFLGEIGAFVANMAIGSVTSNISFFADALGLLFEVLTGGSAQKARDMADGLTEDKAGVLGRIRTDIQGIKDACLGALGAVNDFFGALLDDLRQLLGLQKEGEEGSVNQNGGLFSNLKNFFDTNQFLKDAQAWIDKAITDINAFIRSLPERIGKFVTTVWDVIYGLFYEEKTEYVGSRLETRTVKTELLKWVEQAATDIWNWILDIPNKIHLAAANIYDVIRSWFFKDEVAWKIDEKGNKVSYVKSVKTELTNWIETAVKDIGSWLADLPNKIVEWIGQGFDLVNTLFDKLLGKETVTTTDKSVSEKRGNDAEEQVKARFDLFVTNTVTAIRNWISGLPQRVTEGLSKVGDFLGKLWNTVEEFLFGKKHTYTVKSSKGSGKSIKNSTKTITTRIKSGFSLWLDGVIKSVKGFIKKIPEYIGKGIGAAGNLIGTVINALFGIGENETDADTSKKVEDKLKKPFLGIDLTGILNTIKEIGTKIVSGIASIFTGSDDVETNTKWFADKVAEGIAWIKEKAITVFEKVKDWFINLPTTIASFFKGENTNKQESGPIGKAIKDFGEVIGGFIADLPTAILQFAQGTITEVGKLWDWLYEKLTGEGDETTKKTTEWAENELGYPASYKHNRQKSKWDEFVENLGKTISMAFENLPTWIAKGIDLAVVAIGDIISNIGTWVADISADGKKDDEPELVTAIKNIGEHLRDLFVEIIPGFLKEIWTKISELGEDIYIGISSVFTGDVPQKERQQSVANIAEKIVSFLTTDLPGKIQEAWKTISTLGSQFFEGFSAIFTGETPTSEIGKAVKDFGETIKNFIIKEIPKAIRKAFTFISNLFSGKPNYSEVLKDLSPDTLLKPLDNLAKEIDQKKPKDLTGPINENIEGALKDSNDKAKKDAEKGGFWTFVESIKNGLVSAFENIGPAILDGLSTALDWLSNIGTWIADHLTGEKDISKELDKKYKEENPKLRESLTNIGESLKNFFLDTIPKLIGSAIGTLIKEAPKWFDKLFGAMGKAAKDSEQEASGGGGYERSFDSIENATDLMGLLQGFFEKITDIVGNKDVQLIATIIAVTLLFKQISQLFSAAEVAENIGYTVKWVALTIAFSAVAGILGFISSIVESGDENKISAFERIVDKIAGLFEKIAWVVGLLSAGKIFEMVGSIFDAKAAKGKKGEDSNFLKEGLEGFLGNFLKMLGFGAGLDVSTKLFANAGETALDFITDSFMSITAGVEDFLGGVQPIIDNLIGMESKLSASISVVISIKDLFVKFYTIFDDIFKEVKDSGKLAEYDEHKANTQGRLTTTREYFETELESRINYYIDMATFIDKMANSLKTFSDITDAQQKFEEIGKIINSESFTTMFTNMFDKVHEAYYSSKMGMAHDSFTEDDGKVMNKVALGLEILANAMSVFSDGISGLNEGNIDSFEKSLNIFGKLADAFAGTDLTANTWEKIFKGESSLAVIGRQIRQFGAYMKGFYDSIKDLPGFEANEVKSTNDKISSITILAKGMTEAARDITHYGQDFEYLTHLGERLPGFGESVAEFITKVNESMPQDLSLERSSVLKNAVDGVAQLLDAIGNLKYTSISTVMDNLWKDLHGDGSAKLAGTVRLINDAISEAMAEDDSSEGFLATGAKIAKKIFEGIQQAFDNPEEGMQIEITPVLKTESFDQQIKDTFGLGENMQFDMGAALKNAMGISLSEAFPQPIDYSSTLGEIKAAAEGFGTKMDTIGNAISSMKVVMDTGAIVGQVSPGVYANIRMWENLAVTRGAPIPTPP